MVTQRNLPVKDFLLQAAVGIVHSAVGRCQENCKVQGQGVRSMFSVDVGSVKSKRVGRKMDQTPTLQFSWL